LLPPFSNLESKLLNEEMQIRMDIEKETAGEILYVKKETLSKK
jgi:hypothetical protein